MRTQTIDLPPLTLRADVRPEGVNAEARTADLIFSTGAPVPRFDWVTGTRYLETLSLQKDDVRLDRLNDGAPFLNAHSAFDVGDVLGVVVNGSAKVTGAQAVATVRFSKRADVEPIWQDVRDGILRNVSVGYRVHRYEQTEPQDGGMPLRHAVDWEPYEISAVPMGADAGAHVRAERPGPTTPCVLVTRAPTKEPTMTPEPQPEVRFDLEPTTPAPVPETTEREVITSQERERVQGILRGCEAVRLPLSYAHKLIADGTPLLKAQTQILESLRTRGRDDDGPRSGGTTVSITGADPLEHVWRGITGALLHRVDPHRFPLDDNSKQYRTHSVLRAAEICLEERGIKTRGMTKDDIATLSLGLQQRAGLHTTSDFPNILADVGGKSLRAAYDQAPPTWTPLARRIPISDFKPVKRIQFGEAPELKKVLEHGEFTRGTIAEGKEEFSLSTYGRIFGITRQALINDDLDAFGQAAIGFALAARRKESDLVWAEVLRNAAMADTIAIFHASHANLTSSGTAISIDSLGVGRAMIETQKGLDATTYLSLDARFLIVPPGKRTLAEQFTTAITPALGSSVNPFAGRLTVISEPRLSGGIVTDGETIAGSATAWYLAASPDQIGVIEYGFLDGQEGPVVESRVGWDVDGLEIKCRHDFAAKVIEYRGLYKNVGA